MRKKWTGPRIFFEGGLQPGPGSVIGDGSGQSTTDAFPCDFEQWLVLFDYVDADGNGIAGEWNDYVKWMTDNGFYEDISWDQEPVPEP